MISERSWQEVKTILPSSRQDGCSGVSVMLRGLATFLICPAGVFLVELYDLNERVDLFAGTVLPR